MVALRSDLNLGKLVFVQISVCKTLTSFSKATADNDSEAAKSPEPDKYVDSYTVISTS